MHCDARWSHHSRKRSIAQKEQGYDSPRLATPWKARLVTRVVGLVALVGIALAGTFTTVAAQQPGRDFVPDQNAAQIERDFLMGMIPHHRGAVAMSQMALTKATKPELRELAQKVIDEQTEEMQVMTNYLRDWYGMQPPAGDVMPADISRRMDMPMMQGKMPTPQQMMTEMQTLGTLSGAQFDIMYMSMLSEHHAMATMMAVPVLIGRFHGDLYTLASNVVQSQGEQIVQLRDWLRAWYNVPRPGYNPDGSKMTMMTHS